ncbi:MAG: 50S ribosomal protein L5 [Candidatus Hydrogenedentes bacterium]|nr:50S ribosomal protein L5 [Candidatus Hydrogenedentota bacterium]
MVPRLKEKYLKEVVPEMLKKFSFKNVMQVPRLEKIVINMGVGDATQDSRLLENAMNELALITGQKPQVRKARKSVSNFKLRKGASIGCRVTLRGDRMYEFMDRLFNVAIPRIRDFRGVSPRGFDKFGNYTLGIKEQTIFPEINIDNVNRVRGMNVTFVFKNSTNIDANRELLRMMGMPFSSM